MDKIEKKIDELIVIVRGLAVKVDGLIQAPMPIRKVTSVSTAKQITLPEVAREATFDNGQRRIVAIVGYLEKIKGLTNIATADIRDGWHAGKFPGSYSPVYLHRAIKEGLVRQKEKNAFDLSQSGENFFNEIVK